MDGRDELNGGARVDHTPPERRRLMIRTCASVSRSIPSANWTSSRGIAL